MIENKEKFNIKKIKSKIYNKKNYYLKNNFIFKSKIFPQINNLIEKFNWNCADKTVSVSIFENSDFDVYQWIKYLQNKNEESKDCLGLGQDIIFLIFKNANDKNLSEIRFFGLSIEKHFCCVCKNKKLIHKLKIKYKEEELILLNKNEEYYKLIPNESAIEKISDEEWKRLKN